MTQADRIRQFVMDNYIAPARRAGQRKVVFTAGDIHDALHLNNVYPAISGAVGSQKFIDMANVDMWVKPPIHAASAEFHCEIL